MTDLASLGDVIGAWRPLAQNEYPGVAGLLTYASAIVRARVPGVDDRLLSGQLDRNLVRSIVVQMVLRVLRNPEGKQSETIEDYTYRLGSATSSGTLYLSDDELSLLRGRRSSAFSVAPFRSPHTCDVELDERARWEALHAWDRAL